MQIKKENIVLLPLTKIKPYKKNAKKHPKEQVERIANSIKRFGFTIPILVDGNNIVIAGHGRCLAAKMLGIKEVPCLVKETWTEEEVKAYRLIDNKVNESEWDRERTNEELDELYGLFDMSEFGFNIGIEDIDNIEEGERQISPELGEANNYVVLEFDTEDEWEDAQEVLGLKEVETPDKNPKIRRKGIGRVIKGKWVIDKLKEE